MNKPIFEGLPEAKGQGFEELIDRVYETGESYSAQEVPITLPRNGSVEVVYINFIYEAYHEADGSISGIITVATDADSRFGQKITLHGSLIPKGYRASSSPNKGIWYIKK